MLTLFAYSVQGLISDTLALAAVALIGYLFGQRTRRTDVVPAANPQLLAELTRATQVANELQQIAKHLRNDLAQHQSNIIAFQKSILELEESTEPASWESLGREADKLLAPTLRLTTNLSLAYDQLRKQSNHLMIFSGTRVDSETGILNRRAIEEQLSVMLSLFEQQSIRFSVAMFSMKGSQFNDDGCSLQDFATLLKGCIRGADVLGRYGKAEFVVIMPQTSLSGAKIFSRRLMSRAAERLEAPIHGGLAEVTGGDTIERIISRVDSALYSARTHGASSLYLHTGKMTHPLELPDSAAPKLTAGKSTSPDSDGPAADLQLCDEMSEEFMPVS